MAEILAEAPHAESMTVVPAAKVPSKVRGIFIILIMAAVAPAPVRINERVSVLTMVVVPAQIPSVKRRGIVPIMMVVVDLLAPMVDTGVVHPQQGKDLDLSRSQIRSNWSLAGSRPFLEFVAVFNFQA